MGIIQKMSPHLANMIAAGEVVERPMSVVKELVENAIDAKAHEIKIYLENGGLDLIKVVDDGVGMDSEDITMAFLPHATSKIKTEYDLFRISTLGFRGEAIASIAAVSTMQIISSQDGNEGYECSYKYGVKQSEGISHSNKGTTVIVNNLFFNTPARLKYMKSAKSELASIMFYIDRIALAHPSLRFAVYSDNKLVCQTSGSNNYETLVAEIYGIEAAKNTFVHSYVSDGYKATLVLVKPAIYRSNKLEITMISNGRYVKNYNVTNAVIEGYSTYIPIGKYPIAILYFDMDPLIIDVNVHPSKTEIKISNEESLTSTLTFEIRKKLESLTHIITRDVEKPIVDKFKKLSIFDESFDEEISEPIILKEDKAIYNEPTKIIEEKPFDNIRKIPYMEYVGSIFATYLIFQNDEGMFLIDQHAAHERINYEKYYELLKSPKQPTTNLLVPMMLSFTKQEALFIEENNSKFKELGFYLDQVGNTDYALREIPLWASDNSEDIIYDIISMMIANRKIDVIHFRDSIAKQISCKSSIKANHRINNDEVKSLIDDLNKCNNPFTCPHGRPTIIKLSLTDIEKMFERIQSK